VSAVYGPYDPGVPAPARVGRVPVWTARAGQPSPEGPPLVPAAGVFLAARAVGIFVLLSKSGPSQLGRRLGAWDGVHYLQIAHTGYPGALPAHLGRSNIAFFPLYPLLVRVASRAFVGPPVLWAVVISLLAGTAAAVLLAAVAFRVLAERPPTTGPRRAALAVVAAWSVQPVSFVLSMAYTEALFTALAAGCLLALLTRRWWTAGVAALLAGATRSTGIVLTACCLVAVLGELSRRRTAAGPGIRAGRRRPVTPHPLAAPVPQPRQASVRTGRWRPVTAVAAVVLAPVGTVGYLGWLAVRYHRADAWFVVQRHGWGVYTDGGAHLLRSVDHYATPATSRPAALLVVATILTAAVLLVLLLRQRLPAVLAVYAGGLLVLALSTRGAFGSIPRFLLPAPSAPSATLT
jgi:Mannosyltransferase (PIG-V)